MNARLDDAWFQAYNDAAEHLFGVVNGPLTDEQDDACIAAANAAADLDAAAR
jgi:hypothetical protein